MNELSVKKQVFSLTYSFVFMYRTLLIKNDEEYFDYLGEKFGSPMFTYSLGTLFCLNESSRNIFDTNSGENIFEDLIDNKALVSILPSNIDSIECLANKTGFNSTKDSEQEKNKEKRVK